MNSNKIIFNNVKSLDYKCKILYDKVKEINNSLNNEIDTDKVEANNIICKSIDINNNTLYIDNNKNINLGNNSLFIDKDKNINLGNNSLYIDKDKNINLGNNTLFIDKDKNLSININNNPIIIKKNETESDFSKVKLDIVKSNDNVYLKVSSTINDENEQSCYIDITNASIINSIS